MKSQAAAADSQSKARMTQARKNQAKVRTTPRREQ